MAYSIEIKNKVLVRLAKGIRISEISTELNVSKSTIYHYQRENLEEIGAVGNLNNNFLSFFLLAKF